MLDVSRACDFAVLIGGWCVASAAVARAVTEVRARARARETVLTACHELRAPITSVRLGVELIARSGATAARIRALELELERAALVLDDLTHASGVRRVRCDRRASVSSDGVVDVRSLLEDSVEAWRGVAGSRRLELDMPGGLVARVSGSRPRLAQASGNLIANAIEHGAGDIQVRVRLVAGVVRIEVLDGGRGLPGTVAALIEPRRSRRPSRRFAGRWLAPAGGRHGGLAVALGGRARGRGLAIAAGVAEAHGGRLFSAPVPRGARLVLELPLESSVGARSGMSATAAR